MAQKIRYIIKADGSLLCRKHSSASIPAGLTETFIPPPTMNHLFIDGEWQYQGQIKSPINPLDFKDFKFQQNTVIINQIPYAVTTPLTEYTRIARVGEELIGYNGNQETIVTGSLIVDLAIDELRALGNGMSAQHRVRP